MSLDIEHSTCLVTFPARSEPHNLENLGESDLTKIRNETKGRFCRKEVVLIRCFFQNLISWFVWFPHGSCVFLDILEFLSRGDKRMVLANVPSFLSLGSVVPFLYARSGLGGPGKIRQNHACGNHPFTNPRKILESRASATHGIAWAGACLTPLVLTPW